LSDGFNEICCVVDSDEWLESLCTGKLVRLNTSVLTLPPEMNCKYLINN